MNNRLLAIEKGRFVLGNADIIPRSVGKVIDEEWNFTILWFDGSRQTLSDREFINYGFELTSSSKALLEILKIPGLHSYEELNFITNKIESLRVYVSRLRPEYNIKKMSNVGYYLSCKPLKKVTKQQYIVIQSLREGCNSHSELQRILWPEVTSAKRVNKIRTLICNMRHNGILKQFKNIHRLELEDVWMNGHPYANV